MKVSGVTVTVYLGLFQTLGYNAADQLEKDLLLWNYYFSWMRWMHSDLSTSIGSVSTESTIHKKQTCGGKVVSIENVQTNLYTDIVQQLFIKHLAH